MLCKRCLMPRLQSITDQDGRRVEYVFDALGTLVEAKTAIQYEDEQPVRYLLARYTPETSVVDSKTYTRGLTQSVMNSWNEFDEQTQQWRDAVQFSANAYTYDYGGNRLTNAITYPDETSRTEAYGYDALSRLVGVDYEYSGGTPVFNDAWWYHPAGNRQPASNHSYNVYNAANMLLQAGTNYFTNDLNGNTLTGGGRTNTWDSQNRMVHCTYVDGSTTYRTRFAYGPDGLRRQQESLDGNGIVLSRKRYVLDGTNAAQCWDTTGQTPVFLASYLYGPRGPECRVDAADNAIWFMYDGHGNAVGEVTEDGKVNVDGGETTTLRDYDPWGNMTTPPEDLGPPASLLQYCATLGHPTEDNTGLIYMRARYYDPLIGRFISEDPAGDGRNWYVYAGNDPVDKGDATGRSEFSLGGLNVAIATGEGVFSAASDLSLQAIFGVGDGSLNDYDWGSVLFAGGVGLLGGAYGAVGRYAHYAERVRDVNKMFGAGGVARFDQYLLKFLGVGTSTSSRRHTFLPLVRSCLLGGGSAGFYAAYNEYIDSFMEEQ